VIFPGFIPNEDLPVFYNLAEAFVFPSLYEGFGIPVLEAMACGCPVVTTKTGCSPEVAGGAALLADSVRCGFHRGEHSAGAFGQGITRRHGAAGAGACGEVFLEEDGPRDVGVVREGGGSGAKAEASKEGMDEAEKVLKSC